MYSNPLKPWVILLLCVSSSVAGASSITAGDPNPPAAPANTAASTSATSDRLFQAAITLYLAGDVSQLERIRAMLANGFDPNTRDPDGRTPIRYAALTADDISELIGNPNPPLPEGAREALVDELIEYGAYPGILRSSHPEETPEKFLEKESSPEAQRIQTKITKAYFAGPVVTLLKRKAKLMALAEAHDLHAAPLEEALTRVNKQIQRALTPTSLLGVGSVSEQIKQNIASRTHDSKKPTRLSSNSSLKLAYVKVRADGPEIETQKAQVEESSYFERWVSGHFVIEYLTKDNSGEKVVGIQEIAIDFCVEHEGSASRCDSVQLVNPADIDQEYRPFQEWDVRQTVWNTNLRGSFHALVEAIWPTEPD